MLRLLIYFTLGIYSSATFALDYDLSDILSNMRSIINPFMSLILMLSFLIGIGFVWRGLGMMKRFGMHITQMSQQGEIAGPLVYLVVGSLLIYLPSTTDVLLKTIYGSHKSPFRGNNVDLESMGDASSVLLSYNQNGIEEQWGDLIDTLVLYIQFIGFIAFFRGWLIIGRSGNPGVQPGSISKGIVHVVGGIIAINFVDTMEIIKNTIFA